MAWQVVVDRDDPDPEATLALEVDPRARRVWLGLRVPGSGSLDVQRGAVARSHFDGRTGDLDAAGAWLAGDEATRLLDTVAAGFSCETLWTGDPVVAWTDAAWEAGHTVWMRVGTLLGA